jgi:membrane peptidoglycan carboxypeptidase
VCGEDTQTCDELENGGFRITTTIDLRLQDIAERWVKLAARVPKADDPALAAQRLGFEELPEWVTDLIGKDLNNGALVAVDYETGEIIAYVGSADYYARRGNAKFQPKFDVVANGWRQPGSAFKPFNYLTGIDDRTMTAATMFMDAATDFGGGYTPSNADNLERGPVRVRQALQFSLNIPAVKAMAVNRIEHVFDRAQDYGIRWRETTTDAGLSFALGVEEIRPIDLVTAYGTMANLGRYTGHTTILGVKDREGNDVVPPHVRPPGEQVVSAEAAAILTNILAQNTAEEVNPFWGQFAIPGPDGRRPATLKTGTNNDARDLNAYGYIAPPTPEGRAAGEYALAVGVWNGNSDNTVVSTPENPVFSIDVTTYVWQGFLAAATEGWATNQFANPPTLTGADVDPWVGLLPAEGQEGVSELFIAGTAPTERVGRQSGLCGDDVFGRVGFESRFENWLAADRDWLERARQGPGTVGGPEGTAVSYFYNGSFTPFGASWGPLLGSGSGCATPTPAPTPTCFPLPTPDASGVVPSFEVPSPSGSGPAPLPCPTPVPTPTPEVTPSPSPSPTPEPTPPPTEAPEPVTVRDYRCVTFDEALTLIQEDGFELGEVVPSDGSPDDIVIAQNPAPDSEVPPGSAIDLAIQPEPVEPCPPA